jgi:glycogen operon protein
LGTVLLSLGVPMILGGDEIGRTQRGNNNAYCQDNEISWFDWKAVDKDLLDFTRGLIEVRRKHPALRRRRFASGARSDDIRWFTPTGSVMTDSDWQAGWTRSVMAYLDGTRDPDRDERGRPILDSDLLLIVNGWWEPLTFTLPDVGSARVWALEVDTFSGAAGENAAAAPNEPATSEPADAAKMSPGAQLVVGPRSLVLLQSVRS